MRKYGTYILQYIAKISLQTSFMLCYILRPNFRLLQVDKKACQIVAALQCTMDCCMYQIDFCFRFSHAFSRRE